jgi:hypothetical protein
VAVEFKGAVNLFAHYSVRLPGSKIERFKQFVQELFQRQPPPCSGPSRH